MKYAIIFGAFSYGGAERVASNLANFLIRDNEVIIITMVEQPVCYSLNERISIVNGLSGNKITKMLNLRKVILEKKPDVIISFMTHINIAAIIASSFIKVPVIISERNDPVHVPHQLYMKILRWITYKHADGFVFQTTDAKNYFNKTIRNKSVIIPNPVFINTEPASVAKREKIIIIVSRLEGQKNIPMAISAFNEIHKEYCEWTMHIYGAGAERAEIQSLINRYNANEYIILKGTTSNLHFEIKNGSIFVLPSNYEGMPNSLMEAMALGLAAISTNCPCGGPKELIADGEDGLLIPVGGMKELKDNLKLLMSSEETRIAIGKKAKDKMKKYSPESILYDWQRYAESIVREKTR